MRAVMPALMVEDSGAIVLGVSDFVAILNQTLEYVYPSVIVTGELANFRVSKGKWVYFDLKDEFASVKCFATVYQLPGPLEDGMLLNVRAMPRLHPLYGFSLNVIHLQPAGEGTIRRAAELLETKLNAEGLFDDSRKRLLPLLPQRVGLIASSESAAYADFMKILRARWGGIAIELIDVQVQGEVAPGQIVAAIEQLNGLADPPDVLVVTRGGGSAEDLQAFSTEQVTRAVAASRVPTLVAIGHEIDISLAELAADRRASTPSNAAEILVPDKVEVLKSLQGSQAQLHQAARNVLQASAQSCQIAREDLETFISRVLEREKTRLAAAGQLLEVLSPRAILRRGYAIVRKHDAVILRAKDLAKNDTIQITFGDGSASAIVQK